MLYLGIDFGTTFTKAAVFDPSSGESWMVKLNETLADFGLGSNQYAMPTAVYVPNDNGLLVTKIDGPKPQVGEKAINHRLSPEGTVYENFKPALDGEQEYADEKRGITYKYLVSAILDHVYHCAFQQSDIKSFWDKMFRTFKVVLTVPASTVKGGKRYTRMLEAAKEVGLMDVTILPEPEAAAFFLVGKSLRNMSKNNESSFLIYDFGGGTFDTTVAKVKDEQIFIVNQSVGSNHMQKWGGIYLDAMVRRDYVKRSAVAGGYAKRIAGGGLSLKERLSIENHLRVEPVKAKVALSKEKKYTNGVGDYIISREEFDKMIESTIDETISCSCDLLEEASEVDPNISLKTISKVFLVGGSSRIPLVRAKWEEKKQIGMQGSIEMTDIEVVAQGAAYYHHYSIAPKRLERLGVKYAKSGDYKTAALYFTNSQTDDALFYLATLYYSGAITKGKKAKRQALALLEKSQCQGAKELKALMAFLGHGMVKDDKVALQLAKEVDKPSDMCTRLKSVLCGDWNHLDKIYSYDPLSIFKNITIPNEDD
ncbi:MAG: Hsp70 family protein [Bacteroidales bacterium]|nr:Hsp70 family protein [Bacteroidales bacterium]